jgi:hypothetical protein
MAGNKTQPIAIGDVDAVCLKCHNGKDAKAEIHPIGRTFDSEQVKQPEGWPVPDGKLGCVTCHQTKLRSKDNPAFVRGYKKEEILEFCSRCHSSTKEQERFNPHIMLDKDNNPVAQKCLFCHQTELERDRLVRTGKAELRNEGIVLCFSCHSRHLDYFQPGHIGIKVPPKMLAYMKTFGETQVKRLPLTSEGRVVCWTCHNPHQQGLFPAGSEMAQGARYSGPGLLHRGLGKGLCRGCHDK